MTQDVVLLFVYFEPILFYFPIWRVLTKYLILCDIYF